MTTAPPSPRFRAERLAYWYLRLNGFLTIENFLLHNMSGGGIRTDADVIGVRFPHRAEMLLDDRRGPMEDDPALGLSDSRIDFVIAEVTNTGPCKLNGPWTAREKENINRVLLAMGPLDRGAADRAAEALYTTGYCLIDNTMQLRLLAFGSGLSDTVTRDFPDVKQVTWTSALAFMHTRFQRYLGQKTDVQQWASDGKMLRRMASETRDRDDFVRQVQACMVP